MSDETEQEEEIEVRPTLEELVHQYNAAKMEKSAVQARCDQLKERIMTHYDENTEHEGEILPAGRDYNVSINDQGRTTLFSKSNFEKKYGKEWIKHHLKHTYHRRLSVTKNKDK